jgi:hypothetical protein
LRAVSSRSGERAAGLRGPLPFALALVFGALALVFPLGASGLANTTPVLTGLSKPFELARSPAGDLFYTEEPAANTTRLSVLRSGQQVPTQVWSVTRSFGISDVGFDGAGNAWFLTNEDGAQANTTVYKIQKVAAA